jgi:hypothetical protein
MAITDPVLVSVGSKSSNVLCAIEDIDRKIVNIIIDILFMASSFLFSGKIRIVFLAGH